MRPNFGIRVLSFLDNLSPVGFCEIAWYTCFILTFVAPKALHIVSINQPRTKPVLTRQQLRAMMTRGQSLKNSLRLRMPTLQPGAVRIVRRAPVEYQRRRGRVGGAQSRNARRRRVQDRAV